MHNSSFWEVNNTTPLLLKLLKLQSLHILISQSLLFNKFLGPNLVSLDHWIIGSLDGESHVNLWFPKRRVFNFDPHVCPDVALSIFRDSLVN